MRLEGFYGYSGFEEPEFLASNLNEFLDEVVVNSNYYGDVTENLKFHVNDLRDWHQGEIDDFFEEDLKDLLFQYGIFMNPTYDDFAEFNVTHGLEEDEYISNLFEEKSKDYEMEP